MEPDRNVPRRFLRLAIAFPRAPRGKVVAPRAVGSHPEAPPVPCFIPLGRLCVNKRRRVALTQS